MSRIKAKENTYWKQPENLSLLGKEQLENKQTFFQKPQNKYWVLKN